MYAHIHRYIYIYTHTYVHVYIYIYLFISLSFSSQAAACVFRLWRQVVVICWATMIIGQSRSRVQFIASHEVGESKSLVLDMNEIATTSFG